MQVFTEIDSLVTMEGALKKGGRRILESDLSVTEHAALVCDEQGRVVWTGPCTDLPKAYKDVKRTGIGGGLVLPGFVECHTHSVFAGSRADEFEWRMKGLSYLEIAEKGGGILSTVKATRQASEEELFASAQKRISKFLSQGVTTLETKSGYGLDLETELKILRVGRRLQGPRIVNTYLGAHSKSPDFPDLQTYLNFVLTEVLPKVVSNRLADRIDIYIEKGFYDLDMARQYFQKAKELGLPITAHVEQLSDLKGTELALEFQSQSVDHVVYLSDSAIEKVARSQTTAVLLPASDLYLKMAYPKARRLMDCGARVALSTDFNPGTSPTQDLSLVGVLARLKMQMTQAEVLSAMTVGAAFALGLEHEVGSLTAQHQADFSVFEGTLSELFYSIGHHPVRAVYKSGQLVTPN